MILMVSGSRSINDASYVYKVLDEISDIDSIIVGNAKGVDEHVARYAVQNDIPIEVCRPDWTKGKGAALKCNIDMLKKADALLAVYDGVSKGTSHAIDNARRMGKPVTVKLYE